jgi:hypothetical protein
MDRTVVIVAGPTLSGKSWLLKSIHPSLVSRGTAVVRMDDVRRLFWGERHLTNTEGVYRNELTRNEIKRQLVIEGARLVLAEIPLLTRAKHQSPLLEMVLSAQEYIRGIDRDRWAVGQVPPESVVHLRVIYLYTSLEMAQVRLSQRMGQTDASNTNVFSIEQYLSIVNQTELPEPDLCPILPINMNGGSPGHIDRIMRAVAAFIENGQTPEPVGTLAEAADLFAETRAEATRRGVGNTLP